MLEEVTAWRVCPFDSVYPIVYFDALLVKSREEGAAKTRAVYVALAIDMQGENRCWACGSRRRRGPFRG